MQRKAIVAAQNEIVRKSIYDLDVSLITVGISTCVGLVIYSDNGMESLAHIDKNTDLSFISLEIESFTSISGIYIIRRRLLEESYNARAKKKQKEVPNAIKKYILDNYPEISKEIISMKFIKTDSFIFVDKKIIPTSANAMSLFEFSKENGWSADYMLSFTDQYGISRSHIEAFSDNVDKIDFGPRDFQIRIYTQVMYTFFRPTEYRFPDLVYSDKKWTNDFSILSEDRVINTYMNRLKDISSSNNGDMLSDIKKIFHEVTGKDLNSYSYYDSETYIYTEVLPSQLNNYWGYLENHPDTLYHDEL